MARRSAWLLLASLGVAPTAFAQAADTLPYALEYHAERLKAFAKEPFATNRIIFLGNSITEFGDWKKLLGDTTVVNRGIAGDVTFGILRRLDEVVRRQPRILFIEAGINDIAKNVPADSVAQRMSDIVGVVQRTSPGTRICVISVLPTNARVKKEYPNAYGKNGRVRTLNAKLRANAARDGYTYVDLYRVVSTPSGQLSPQYADKDGLHLNGEGYRAWVKLLRNNKLLP